MWDIGLPTADKTVKTLTDSCCLLHEKSCEFYYYFYNNKYTLYAFTNSYILIFYSDPADRRQTLISSVVHVSVFHPYMTTVWIDRSLGHDTEFTFQYDTNIPEVSIKSPNDSVYQSGNSSYFEHDSSLKILSFTLTSMSRVRPYGFP